MVCTRKKRQSSRLRIRTSRLTLDTHMKRILTVAIAIFMLVLLALPAAAVRPAIDYPIRMHLKYGEGARISFPHDDTWCWNLRENKRGRWVAVVRDGYRAYRGAPCRGDRLATFVLPRGIMEDQINLFQRNGLITIFILRYD